MKKTKLKRDISESYKINSRIVFSQDVWVLSKGRTINFSEIRVPWLKKALKHFMKLSLVTVAASTVNQRFKAVQMFNDFIVEEYGILTVQEVNREVIVEFLNYLADYGYSANTRATRLSLLKTFFEISTINKWAKFHPYLLTPRDFPKKLRTVPKFIPDEIIDQIIDNSNILSDHVLAMLLVLMETGMRVSELCSLKKHYLFYDAQGNPFLKRVQTKNKQELSVPITRDLEKVIIKQIVLVEESKGIEFEYLFPSISNRTAKIPAPMSSRGFREHLRKFSILANLKTKEGKPYHLHPHLFRHTVATQMINRGVPIHFIQRFLGHNSPEMTIRTYAYIHDQTLKKELENFQNTKTVNISGQAINFSNDNQKEIDLEFFKKNVLTQALPNGYCARPAIRGDCPHANACLTCGDFRTTKEFLGVHQEELEKTKKVLEKAKENGWQRQIEMNTKVFNNLEKIISSLNK